MPTKPNNRKGAEEFVDQHHPVVRAYDRLLEDPPDDSLLKRELWRLIDQDPLFLDPYLALANIVMEEGRLRGSVRRRARSV